jgi:hypothetical protein
MTRRFAILAGVVLLTLAGAGCAAAPEASRSLRFDAASKSAIVVIGTNANEGQEEAIRSGRSLSSFWMEYDPDARRLVPNGKTFLTKVEGGVFAEPSYLKPTVSVLEVEPGDYALVGAGFPHLGTTFVASKRPLGQRDFTGRPTSWHFTVDPRMHVEPDAPIQRENFVFSVRPGEVVYIGHFEFQKSGYSDGLRSIDYSQDEKAAREVLARFPGVAAELITLDLREPLRSAARDAQADDPGVSGPMVTFDRKKPPQQVAR